MAIRFAKDALKGIQVYESRTCQFTLREWQVFIEQGRHGNKTEEGFDWFPPSYQIRATANGVHYRGSVWSNGVFNSWDKLTASGAWRSTNPAKMQPLVDEILALCTSDEVQQLLREHSMTEAQAQIRELEGRIQELKDWIVSLEQEASQ